MYIVQSPVPATCIVMVTFEYLLFIKDLLMKHWLSFNMKNLQEQFIKIDSPMIGLFGRWTLTFSVGFCDRGCTVDMIVRVILICNKNHNQVHDCKLAVFKCKL